MNRFVRQSLRQLSRMIRHMRSLPAQNDDLEFRVRRLIYCFDFEAADKLLQHCQEATIPIGRLREAIAWNRKSSLLVQSTDQELPDTSRHLASGTHLGESAGSWRVRWADTGRLRINGTASEHCKRVGVFVNDRLVKLVNTDVVSESDNRKRSFRFNLRANVLKRFPEDSRLSIGSTVGYLEFRKGGITYRDERLNGDNRLFSMLENGYFINKKGLLQRTFGGNDALKEQALSAYVMFREYFEQRFAYKPYLICGTLLGYHRDGDFIPHDDDMDVAYFSHYQSPEEVKEEMKHIVLQMLCDGFDIKLARRIGFFKPKINGLLFDVTPMWYDRDTFWMLNATRIPGPRNIIEPITTGRFRGVEVYVPNDPEQYLELEYGPAWRVPDPGYRTVAAPDTVEYLSRSCLSEAELRQLVADARQQTGVCAGMGNLSAVGRNLLKL